MKEGIKAALKVLEGCAMQVFIKTSTGKTITLDVKTSDTIDKMKALILEEKGYRYTFGGKQLKDGVQTVSDYNIQNESTIFEAVAGDGGGVMTGKGCPTLAALSIQHRCRRLALVD